MTQRLLPAKRTNFLFHVSLRAAACCLLVLFLTSVSSGALASIFYVKVNGIGSGASYWANASGDLQAVINAAHSGDEIWVAAGTYKPGGDANTDRAVSFTMKTGVNMYGGFVGNETSLNERPAINQTTPSITILSGEIGDTSDPEDNSFHVILNRLGATSITVLDGFVITGGNASEPGTAQEPQNIGGGICNLGQPSIAINNCLFLDNSAASGGAIYNGVSSDVSGPVLTNCVFRNNTASGNGGAICNVGGSGSNIQPKLTNCLFQANSADAGGAIYNDGYGFRGRTSSPEISNCAFEDNRATSGGAVYNNGQSDDGVSSPVLTNCSFKNNHATNQGGAIFNNGDFNGNSSPLIRNCVFQTNSADSGGGAIFNLIGYVRGDNMGRPKLTNCLFQANTAAYGGAIYTSSVWEGEIELLLTNCTFQANTAGFNGGAIVGNGYGNGYVSNTTLINCVLFGNGGAKTFWNRATTVSATYTVLDNSVQGYSGSTGNIKVTDSPFASATDPTLFGCSPAVNAGLNSAAGIAGVDSDLAGNPRIFDGRVDMGAYEYQSTKGLAITVPSVNTATVGIAFSQSFTASGGTAGPGSLYNYTLASGSLPAGLALAYNGTLTGAPTEVGSFSVTVSATDGSCSGVSAAYVLNVASSTPIRYVMAGASGSGNSWTDASGDLQSQIDYIGAEQVWVAAGTYKPTTTNRSISFSMKNGVHIYGGFKGTETALNQRVLKYPLSTILSGDIGTDGDDTDNSYHVFNNPAGLNNSAVLDGFLITGSNANGNLPDDSGGGMLNNGNGASNSCSPLVRNCMFLSNKADNSGGAVYNGGYTDGNSNPTFINCVFQSNAANRGGAIYNDGSVRGKSSPSLINCSFQANSATFGGAMGNVGYQGSSRPVMTNCVVWGNGGANTFYYGPNASITTSYCLFEVSVTGYSLGTGNLTTTILPFVSATDTRLRAGSEAINAGDPNSTSTTNGNSDLAGHTRFDEGRIDMGAYEFDAAALPVSLVSFTAQVQPDHTVLLKWQTASEWNNKAYLIERSKDLKNFESVGQVSDVGGTSNVSQAYRFVDTNPYQGTSYYRLKQVDLDGSSHTYSAKSVIIEGNYGVYPNPVVGRQFTLNLDEPSSAVLRLYSVTGLEISLTRSASSSASTVIRTGSLFTSGIYLLSVEERGTLRVHRLVVQ
ncbi:choice-of-anchor Q domain-containing protein [Dyadobacter luticola]|uniref:T9SS type A sorting domain-containing protein n=1 Tax=Dyadobacter luticola TaxID=1979387 RepID=A0A5R9KM08_9BACT|nr:choice-of-anchor Q domain-containing protein [Dyadobacter luticola]TLU97263.1 T9SS type A sorting domain-containing protein [Dyadobacter luticola]